MEQRPTCVLCACKHLAQARALKQLAQARVLCLELHKGYPEHFWFALGHLAEAEDELVMDFPELAEKIRGHRKTFESDPRYKLPFAELILEIASVGGYDVTSVLEDAP